MKRVIKAETAKDVERITIDFYGGIDLTEIEAASNLKRVFKNTKVVMRDVKAYLESKGLKVLNMSKSSNEGSDSTYYDVDVQVATNTGKLKYVYFRISDHDENLDNERPRRNYHDRLTRQYANLAETDSVEDLYRYKAIAVVGKAYNNYDRAMNYVKRLIDETLSEGRIL